MAPFLLLLSLGFAVGFCTCTLFVVGCRNA